MTTKRPEMLTGATYKRKIPCGSCYITINGEDKDKEISEVFITAGKSGTCAKAMLEGVGRVVSIALKSKADRNRVIKSLKGINCGNSNDENESCLTQVARVIEEHCKYDGKN